MKPVLLVDDNHLLRSAISRVLHEYYPEVKEVSSGPEALQEISSRHYHLCLLDLDLPGANGLSLMKKIRELSPGTKVVAMAGISPKEELQREIEEFSFCFLAKPFEISDLKEIARKALEKTEGSPLDSSRRSRIKTFEKPIDYSVTVLEMGKPISLPLKGEIVDITKFGIGIRTHYPLEPGQLLIFTSGLEDAEQKAGIVKWSAVTEEILYRVGVEFIEDGRSFHKEPVL